MVTFFKRSLKYLGYSLFFILALMYFTPKIAIYYLLEDKLNPHAIVISDEKLQDNGLYLSINDAVISVKGIESAKISEIKIKLFGLYNSLNLTDVKLSSAAASLTPVNINKPYISHSIFDPLNVTAYADGGFGEMNAKFNLIDFNLHLDLEASATMKKDFKSTLRNLKKLKIGVYSYDKTFKL